MPPVRRDETSSSAFALRSSVAFATYTIGVGRCFNIPCLLRAITIRSTPPATPVAPISFLPNASVSLLYLPPPTNAQNHLLGQMLQKPPQNNSQVHALCQD